MSDNTIRRACIDRMNRLGSLSKPFAFLIDFEERMPRVWDSPLSQDEFLFDFDGRSNHGTASVDKVEGFPLVKTPISLEAYTRRFETAMRHIRRGDSYLVNITAPTRVEIDADPTALYASIRSRYKCLLQDGFICFSPETFLRIREGRIHAHPMKGTIDADLPDAQETIMRDAKETAEHATIVDLIRNDLSLVAADVRVERYRYYEVIQAHGRRIGQVSSEIVGDLPSDFTSRIGDILFSQLPAGSVSGAPKKKTVSIICEAEGEDRGYYTGVAGYFDGRELDSCVLIRFMEAGGVYRSGGGITSRSRLENEYREMVDKVYVPLH
jgi:para-aminobenzoate synthetase component 1